MTATDDIRELELQIYELTRKLNLLKRDSPSAAVPDYVLKTATGEARLSDCFGEHDHLLVIHNMGQACRYCTLWGDGINGVLPHLESAMSVLLVSKDSPDIQRNFANSRGWRFQLASHGGGAYIQEQNVSPDGGNYPGAVVYEKVDGQILRRNACIFGPGDLYCVVWNLLALAGISENSWTPQYRYWQRPAAMEDGGENVID